MNDYEVIVISGECFYWACIPSKTVLDPAKPSAIDADRKQVVLSCGA
jgi:pyruvate/2-oxoglutarate dehydrogenase complex dihydrolipoamide dehydrogenase (E3) component